jgi:nickel-dependent lactate racemase
MNNGHIVLDQNGRGLSEKEIESCVAASLPHGDIKRALLIPPDATRAFSGAGAVVKAYSRLLGQDCRLDILPALGTHVPMTDDEIQRFYPVPKARFITHNWRDDIVKIGLVPAQAVSEISKGLLEGALSVEVNRCLLDPEDGLIVSVGQVVPHEVIGMANYTKNILVGCGGSAMINASHILGAFYGMERIMGKDHSPVRKLFDYVEERMLGELPLTYALTVTTAPKDETRVHGLYIGRDRRLFEQAVALSQKKNLTFVDEPFKKVVAYLDPSEFRSTWVGNKAIYRTRMAIADGGELVILAPGVERFGEDGHIDRLIRKFGYCGRERIIALCKQEPELKENLSAAAHLIHGSSDGRFKVTYCTEHLTQAEVEGVGFAYLPYAEASKRYAPGSDGYVTLPDGERVYCIGNPAVGLWADRSRF